jgi:hypothetical protein
MTALKYGQMTLTVETVTPALAARWLEKNTNNRPVRKSFVAQYARDMEGGNWHMKPVAICFDEDGVLGNGQHTLSAIVQSGRPQELLIARGVTRKSIAFMDVGLRRTVADVSHFVGSNFESRAVSVIRIVAFGLGGTRRSFDELFDAYLQHKQVVDFVLEGRRKAVCYSAPVLAVCARALYTREWHKILRFLDILQSGVVTDASESAAVRLRDFLRSRTSSGNSATFEAYRKTQSSLDAFLRGVPMTRVYGTAEELFPLPENTVGASSKEAA